MTSDPIVDMIAVLFVLGGPFLLGRRLRRMRRSTSTPVCRCRRAYICDLHSWDAHRNR